MTEYEEKDLIEGCKNGNRIAQKRLYDLFSEHMYAICLRYTKNPSDAQDALQDGFVRIYKNMHLFRGEGSFEGWIKRVMVNAILAKIKRDKRLVFTEDIDKAVSTEIDNDAVDQISASHLRELIQDLPPGYRLVFNMHEIEGFNHKEIAEELNISVGTSKSQLARARKMLKDKLELYKAFDKRNLNY